MRLGKSVFKKLVIVCLLLLALTTTNGLMEPQTALAIGGYTQQRYTFYSDSSHSQVVGTIICDPCECTIEGIQTNYYTHRVVQIAGNCP